MGSTDLGEHHTVARLAARESDCPGHTLTSVRGELIVMLIKTTLCQVAIIGLSLESRYSLA